MTNDELKIENAYVNKIELNDWIKTIDPNKLYKKLENIQLENYSGPGLFEMVEIDGNKYFRLKRD